jgi:hypothetical protein
MLDFICELDRVIIKWPADASWTLTQVADATNASVTQVVDLLSDTLDRELEVAETVTRMEAEKALGILKERMSGELAARERQTAARRDKAIKAYDAAMDKVRALQVTKNWRSAYKTLSYYVGLHERDIPEDMLFTLCGECIRLGTKAEANTQELSQWLRKGVATCLKASSPQAVEDAIDFIDASSDAFMADGLDAERGRRLIGNVVESIREHAESFNMTSQLAHLTKELRLP